MVLYCEKRRCVRSGVKLSGVLVCNVMLRGYIVQYKVVYTTNILLFVTAYLC